MADKVQFHECPVCLCTLSDTRAPITERMQILADFARALEFEMVAKEVESLIPLFSEVFAQQEPEAPAGILGAGVSATGEGAQPSPKTHASPARSAQCNGGNEHE